MTDPRMSIIDRRFSGITKIIAVSSAKGGVGKSLTSSVLALLLSKNGKKVGLLDLDFTSPSTHIILGIKDGRLKEKNGILPPKISGIKYMSIIFFSKDNPTPLRGIDYTNSFLEMLAITKWGKLDYLLIDMPPGIGDITLDIIRFIKNIKFLVIATPSPLAISSVKKLLDLLKSVEVPVIGVVENMKKDDMMTIKKEIEQKNIPFLGSIEYDDEIEKAIGETKKILSTRFAASLDKFIKRTDF
ncbi:MAG: Mrp/NBP35 family ATP-binding protein [Nitrososphaeria archaeon]|jgi:ATP-binding protein involved in chromosome partitioning